MNPNNNEANFEEKYFPVKEYDGCAGCGKRMLVTGLVLGLAYGVFKLCTHAPFIAAIKAIPISAVVLGVGLGIALTVAALSILAWYCLKDCRIYRT